MIYIHFNVAESFALIPSMVKVQNRFGRTRGGRGRLEHSWF